ncbi:MAG: prefoldin subunit [archaeon]
MEKDIQQLQVIEQNIQHLSGQRQQFQAQQAELESALQELTQQDDAYRIIGNLMVKTPTAQLRQELQEKKELLVIRIKNIEKQEEKLKKKSEDIRSAVLAKMK